MKNRYIHTSKFGYFYAYCLKSRHKKIKREISKIIDLVEQTNDIEARNNVVYNKKLSRKELRLENILKKIAIKDSKYLIDFITKYSEEVENIKQESDPQLIARNISQSFYDIYEIKPKRKNNVVLEKNNFKIKETDIIINLTDKDKDQLDDKKHSDKPFSTFLSEIKK